MERILRDEQHWTKVLPKLEAFWWICALPEVLGCWYTRWCMVEVKGPADSSICFCRTLCDGDTVACSNEEYPYGRFHTSWLSLGDVTIPKNGTGTALTALDYHSLRWLTTVSMDYNSPTSNSFQKCSKMFFLSLFTVCLSLLPFSVKLEQLNVNKFPIWMTEYLRRDSALVG